MSIRVFSFLVLSSFSLLAGPFSLEVEVSSLEGVNRAGGVSADFNSSKEEFDPSEDESFGVGEVVTSPVGGGEPLEEEWGIPSPPVVAPEPVRLNIDMVVNVEEGVVSSSEAVSSSGGVRFLSHSSSRAPILKRAKGDSLPPLSEDVGPLPGGEPSKVVASSSGPVLLTRGGEMIEGVPAMMDYLLDRAVPARPASGVGFNPVVDPSYSVDSILEGLGSPTDSRETVSERGVPLENVQPAQEVGVTGFFPMPPQGYVGEVFSEPVLPVVSGAMW